jgi:CRISPR/Cas system-associated endonuclease Cas1
LVFDIADLIKDSLILPWAFICAKEQMSEQEFRQQCLQMKVTSIFHPLFYLLLHKSLLWFET